VPRRKRRGFLSPSAFLPVPSPPPSLPFSLPPSLPHRIFASCTQPKILAKPTPFTPPTTDVSI
jgi:hypothetical protein